MSEVMPFSTPISQASAVPFRRVRNQIEFCVITTTSGRWVFPKGNIDPGESLEEAALKEAFEEAGVVGRVVYQPLGSYIVSKSENDYEVKAVLMEVTACHVHWQEDHFRSRRWVSASEARGLVTDRGMIGFLDQSLRCLDVSTARRY